MHTIRISGDGVLANVIFQQYKQIKLHKFCSLQMKIDPKFRISALELTSERYFFSASK